MRFKQNQLLPGEADKGGVAVEFGSYAYYAVGVPQIGVSESKYPESAQHIEEAWAGQSTKTGNNPVFRPGIPQRSPHLVTLDRPNKETRARKDKARTPTCVDKHTNPEGLEEKDQKDEYPPASTKESYDPLIGPVKFRGNLKCIPFYDNAGAGSSFGNQYNRYVAEKNAPPVRILDNSTIEFVIVP
jgi:hypothetical protein